MVTNWTYEIGLVTWGYARTGNFNPKLEPTPTRTGKLPAIVVEGDVSGGYLRFTHDCLTLGVGHSIYHTAIYKGSPPDRILNDDLFLLNHPK